MNIQISTYLNTEIFQNLLMMCRETRQLGCGKTQDYYNEYETSITLSKSKKLLSTEVVERRNWKQKLGTLGI